jgi:hypothetical protein
MAEKWKAVWLEMEIGKKNKLIQERTIFPCAL